MMESGLLRGLNKEQKEAVECTNGPLLVLAGAGSGKTRVLTHRVGYLIENGVPPWNILAITFTNKAAGEMKDRISALLGDFDAGGVFVSTFHSMCVRLLRRDIEKLGYRRDFVIYDADDQRALVRNSVKKLNLDSKVYRERSILSLISANKNKMISAGEFAGMTEDFYDRNAARIFAEYENELKSNNALDFDDLLLKTVELFNAYPDVLRFWQDRFRYILVDEYQDTNNVQFEIVRLLADKHKNLCVVGDDDQSIYRFRGANIENILSFEKSFPGARVIKLEQNYRSTKSILSAANEVIKNNRGRKEKILWTENGIGETPTFTEYDTAAAEADAIVGEAVGRKAAGVSLGRQAVLYRTNAQSRLLEERCVAQGVPYIIVGGVNFYQRKEIKDILAYLRVIANGSDDLSFRRIINTPKRGIGDTTVAKILSAADAGGISAYELCLRGPEINSSAGIRKKIKEFVSYIESLKAGLAGGRYDIKGLIENILEEGGYKEELNKDDPISAESRLENIDELINKAVSFSEENDAAGEGGLPAFLEDVSLIADIDRTDIGGDALTMMTIHSAKGLEFDEVYLSGMEEGLFPSAQSVNSDDPAAEIEEERRLCYVGITRAKNRLSLSASGERLIRGEMNRMKPSRFIDEIPEGIIVKKFRRRPHPESFSFGRAEGGRYEERILSGDRRILPAGRTPFGPFGSLDTTRKGKGSGGAASSPVYKGLHFEKQKPDYAEGDRVRHIKFGDGTVLDITEKKKDYKVRVDFDNFGIKEMYAGFARMDKL